MNNQCTYDTMKITLITFASSFMTPSAMRTTHQKMLSALEQHFDVTLLDYQDIDSLPSDAVCVPFIASGGTERLYQQCFEKLPRPYLLLADGQANSLAASLEISAWIRQSGQKSEILHGDMDTIIRRIKQYAEDTQSLRALKDKRIGVIGAPSSWLIASDVDYFLAKQRWGVNYVDIPLEHLIEYYHATSGDDYTTEVQHLIREAVDLREGTQHDVHEALRLYHALKRIVIEERFNAITLSCFSLIECTGTTGCLALSLLNDEGIVAGCEGDLQTVFTMLLAKTLTGQDTFMANPSIIDTKRNELLISHCTIGLKQTRRYLLRSHFESGKGIGIQGILPEGPITLVKCGGKCLDTFFVSDGTLLENTDHPNMCRTQLRLKLQHPVNYFLHHPIGNHHILIEGHHALQLQNFLQIMGCSKIE